MTWRTWTARALFWIGVGLVVGLVAGCGGAGAAAGPDANQLHDQGDAGAGVSLQFGQTDATGLQFEPLPEGATVDGCFAVRTVGMGDRLSGFIEITNGRGDVARGQWDALVLVCLPDYCYQLPVCVNLDPLGLPSNRSGAAVTVAGAFTGNGATVPFETGAVLK